MTKSKEVVSDATTLSGVNITLFGLHRCFHGYQMVTPVMLIIAGCRRMLLVLSQEWCSCTSACSWNAGPPLPLLPSCTWRTSTSPMSLWTQRVGQHRYCSDTKHQPV